MPTRSFYIPAEGREEDMLRVRHPIDGEMRIYGAFWTDDSFTFALVRDGVIIPTGEIDPNPPRAVGPEAIMQHRRVSQPRKRMRIMNPPTMK